jgi:hypothetical protein
MASPVSLIATASPRFWGVLVAAIVLWPRVGLAEGQRAHLEVTRSAHASACPDAPALAAAVTRTLGREALDTTLPSNAPLRFEVAFVPGETGYVATVRESGVNAEQRTLAGKDAACGDLTEALAAAIGWMLDRVEEEPASGPGTRLASPEVPAKTKVDPDDTPPRSPPPPAHLSVELAALAGSGAGSQSSPSPFGFGFGIRAGVTYSGVYGGLSFVNYLGESRGAGSFGSLTVGGEVGYGAKCYRQLTLRGQVGLGSFFDRFTAQGGNPYVEPGVVAMLSLGPIAFVGADANLLIVPGYKSYNTETSLSCSEGDYQLCSPLAGVTFHAELGANF